MCLSLLESSRPHVVMGIFCTRVQFGFVSGLRYVWGLLLVFPDVRIHHRLRLINLAAVMSTRVV